MASIKGPISSKTESSAVPFVTSTFFNPISWESFDVSLINSYPINGSLYVKAMPIFPSGLYFSAIRTRSSGVTVSAFSEKAKASSPQEISLFWQNGHLKLQP